jgi:hypothetical protein
VIRRDGDLNVRTRAGIAALAPFQAIAVDHL